MIYSKGNNQLEEKMTLFRMKLMSGVIILDSFMILQLLLWQPMWKVRK